VLGFVHGWLIKFAKQFENIVVICLKKGEYDLPPNVKVLSLGKENKVSRLRYLLNFYKYIWNEHRNYDYVFVHMNTRYVVLGWPFWRLWHKIISFWYAHGHVPLMLKLADRLADVVFTSTPEGYRLPSKKLKIVGQGIDIDVFRPAADRKAAGGGTLKIMTVGRISPIKNCDILIKVARILKNGGLEDFIIKIAGAPISKQDVLYLNNIKRDVQRYKVEDKIVFVGPIPNKDIPGFYQKNDIFINLSDTGSLDKAVLEAMACSILVLSSNDAARSFLPSRFIVDKTNPQDLADKIKDISRMSDLEKTNYEADFRKYVTENHNLEKLVTKIAATYEAI